MTNRELLHQLADVVADALDRDAAGLDYYDQKSSPLPSVTHCRLVRKGILKGFKVAGRVLVKRSEMHAYIASKEVEPIPAADEPESEQKTVDALLRSAGLKRKPHHAA
jgi:hypothetical protein